MHALCNQVIGYVSGSEQTPEDGDNITDSSVILGGLVDAIVQTKLVNVEEAY